MARLSMSGGWFPWNIAEENHTDQSRLTEMHTEAPCAKHEQNEDLEPSTEKESQNQLLRTRASMISLPSLNTGAWLNWSSKAETSSLAADKNGNGSNGVEGDNGVGSGNGSGNASGNGNSGENGNRNGNGNGGNGKRSGKDGKRSKLNRDNEDEDADDYLPDDNGDEVEENASQGSRKKLWSFWSSLEEAPKESNHPFPVANTIFKSTPTFPAQEDTQQGGKKDDVVSNNEAGDDAVLYKPHNSAKQFDKINTHKNENLKENIIVPQWESCLPALANSINASTSQQASIVNPRNVPFDLKNWRGYLSYISSRFGFGSTSSSSAQSSQSPLEKEFKSLNDHSYPLYGRSLNRLPPLNRACLPNYIFYHRPESDASSSEGKHVLVSEEEQNPVSVTSDMSGNLLINPPASVPPSPNVTVVKRLVGSLKKIKKILIIGVHGFFPTRMIRPIIGAPKGTSLKFANEAEKAIIRYCLENKLLNDKEESSISIQKIALEKEGKIFDRVTFFVDILTKWEQELNEADFIFVAAHSQGCVVSIILLAQLIKSGILKNAIHKRIGILGMAGVNNGPFYGVDKSLFMKAYSAIEHESLLELFELNKFESPQSVAYKESMQILVSSNVKLCLIGSINDLLVPLYSALASHIFHPNIYRACYIDHSTNTPEFITRLVSICCQLQNLGFFDNNVIRELSASLPGPVTGGGHSRIYNDGKVYNLGVKFALDTDDLVIPSIAPGYLSNGKETENDAMGPINNRVYIKEYNVSKIGTNPFILPWCVRGLIFNIQKNWPIHGERLDDIDSESTAEEEIQALYESFDKWKPVSKTLKHLRFRLNGIRTSKL